MPKSEFEKLETMLVEKALISGPNSALNLIYDAVQEVRERGGKIRRKPLRRLITKLVQATMPEIAGKTQF